MAIPRNHRWIALGNLIIRNDDRATPAAPKFNLSEVIAAADERRKTKTHLRKYGTDQSRIMWIRQIADADDFVVALFEIGDQNTTGVSFIDFDTMNTRDIEKGETEGGHYSSHVLIAKSKSAGGGHLVLVERLPGIYLASVKAHLAWLARDLMTKTYIDEAGKPRTTRAILLIDGHQSSTIADALKTGKLQDIEFVRSKLESIDGLDEDPVPREVTYKATLDIKQKVSEKNAAALFASMRERYRKFKGDDDDAKMFVRIKTAASQIKQTEITDGEHSILEQAFVHNDIIDDFDEPLNQRYEVVRQDVIEKMIKIARDQLAKIGTGRDA